MIDGLITEIDFLVASIIVVLAVIQVYLISEALESVKRTVGVYLICAISYGFMAVAASFWFYILFKLSGLM